MGTKTARSVHTAVLKLPRPLPHAHSALPSDGLNRSELTKPVPFANRYLYSDSDDEGSYTVTDHDVRLAYVSCRRFSRYSLKVA